MAIKKGKARTKAKPKASAAKQRRSEPAAPAKRPAPPRGRPFQKGQSGNPKGRPPIGMSIAELVRKIGDEEDKKERIARIEVVVRKLFKTATIRSQVGIKAAALLIERGWGKPAQQIEMTGKDGTSLVPGSIVFTMPKNGRDGPGTTPIAPVPSSPTVPLPAKPTELPPPLPKTEPVSPTVAPPTPPARYTGAGRDSRVVENVRTLKPISDGGPAASTGKR